MTNDDIIQQYLKKGKLLTPEALEALRSGSVMEDAGLFVTKSIQTEKKKDSIRVLKNITEVRTEMTAGDFAGFYKSKYDKMTEIFLSRLQKDFVSLNKISGYREEVH